MQKTRRLKKLRSWNNVQGLSVKRLLNPQNLCNPSIRNLQCCDESYLNHRPWYVSPISSATPIKVTFTGPSRQQMRRAFKALSACKGTPQKDKNRSDTGSPSPSSRSLLPSFTLRVRGVLNSRGRVPDLMPKRKVEGASIVVSF